VRKLLAAVSFILLLTVGFIAGLWYQEARQSAQRPLLWGSAPLDSQSYQAVAAIAKLVGTQSTTPQALVLTGGSAGNLREVREGRVDIAYVNSLDLALQPDAPVKQMLSFGYWSFGVVAPAAKGWSSFPDLRGKNLFVGTEGGMAHALAQYLISAYGWSDKDLNLVCGNWDEGLELLSAGKVDALLVNHWQGRLVPDVIAKTYAREPFNLLDISDEVLNKLLEQDKGILSAEMSGELYNQPGKKLRLPAVSAILICGRDFSKENAGFIKSAYLNNPAKIKEYSWGLVDVDEKWAAEGLLDFMPQMLYF